MQAGECDRVVDACREDGFLPVVGGHRGAYLVLGGEQREVFDGGTGQDGERRLGFGGEAAAGVGQAEGGELGPGGGAIAVPLGAIVPDRSWFDGGVWSAEM